MFGWLKEYRRIVTRTDKLARSYAAMVLKNAGCGKTSYEISMILDCTEAAVNFYFGNVRRKFDVHTRTAALLKASVLGVITPTQ